MVQLELRNVTKRFGGLTAVDGVSLSVEPGEFVGIIGPNGSGKSTLFHLISGVLRTDGGSVHLGGEPIDALRPADIFARGLVRNFQIPRLFYGMSVLENLLVPPKGQVGERLTAALFRRRWRDQEIALAERAVALLRAFGLGEVAGNPATDLSGGQMKLLEAARAMMGDPRVLLLDEPAAGVAPKLARDIFERLQAIQREQGTTFIVIEHRLEVLFDFAQRIIVLDRGRVIAEGSPEQIVRDPNVIAAYFGGVSPSDGAESA